MGRVSETGVGAEVAIDSRVVLNKGGGRVARVGRSGRCPVQRCWCMHDQSRGCDDGKGRCQWAAAGLRGVVNVGGHPVHAMLKWGRVKAWPKNL